MGGHFAVLSAVDCSKHIEKKGTLSYLSWTWAWAVLMQHYPDSAFEFLVDDNLADGTVMVSCTVTVCDTVRKMWLPVMDNRNNAIAHPNARQISDARMRCLVKCIALHGLGLYIYAGEDLPESVADAAASEQDVAWVNDALEKTGSDVASFCRVFGIKNVAELKQAQVEKAVAMLSAKLKKLENKNAN